jgi:DNA invertase Pin-like site-specific DNA recombinase
MSTTISLSPLASHKIQQTHYDRLAVVYVRQSHPQQVLRHQESTRLQYGLAERAQALGWVQSQVLVIDEDLGKSADSVAGRSGFQRLVAEVSLAHVGIILGLEMSRLARSNRDWHHLLEVCALFGTLIGDLDGIYDPTDYNDRLLLGLKGAMSEAELHVLKQRMVAGKRAKAERGELGMLVPMGYIRRPSGEVVKDPDEQAQAVIALIFEQFERLGTIHGVLRYLVQHQVRVPQRLRFGPSKGELVWRRPNRTTLSNLLHHPIYAGAYVYGRRPTDPKRKQPGRPSTGRLVAQPEDCQVLLHDRLAAYISWEQFERNRRQLEANTQAGLGVIRYGPSLLSGLVVCGRCGLRMAAVYNNNGTGLRYNCAREMVDYGGALCQSLAGLPLDAWISALVLQALEPAALEVSLAVAADVEAQRQRLHQQWDQRLERAAYEVDRAARHYRAVDPENRLVARTLERQWEDALQAQERLQADHRRLLAQQPATLSAAERDAIRRLASDLPALWQAQTTTAADRQAIIRQLVERVVVTVQGESEKVDLEVHWMGGHRTHTQRIRPVARLDQLSYYPDLLARAAVLHQEGLRRTAIAQVLNREGWRPPKRRPTFTAEMVHTLLRRQGLGLSLSRPRSVRREADEWTLPALAYALEMPHPTLYRWLCKGYLKARRDQDGGQWLIWADVQELQRLRARRQAPRVWTRPSPKTSSEPSGSSGRVTATGEKKRGASQGRGIQRNGDFT